MSAVADYLKPTEEPPCLRKLDDPGHTCVTECEHPMRVLGMLYNHAESWRCDRQFAIISHPYYLSEIVPVALFVQDQGWNMEVYSKSASWFNPGVTWLVMTFGRLNDD